MRTSLRHVAERAGVSRVTASNVARGRDEQMSPATRERVLLAMSELQYTPVSQPAMQNRHVVTRTLGLVFDHIQQDDLWGVGTFRGLRDGALEHDYDLLTILRAKPKWDLGRQELRFLDRRSDGLIFIVPKDRYGVLETLVSHQIPCVTCYIDDVPPGVASVVLDNAGAMRRAVEYLVEKGHHKIAHLAWQAGRSDFRERLKGFKQAARRAGLSRSTPVVHAGDGDEWENDLISLIETEGITAITCSNDLAAFQVWWLAKKRGWKIPRDLALIGMDDMPEAATMGLTTMGFCCEEVGRLAIETMIRGLRGDEAPARQIVPVKLVERSSVAAPPSKVT